VPLPADPSTPIGDDDRANREVARHGEPPHFSFTPQGHIALGKKLDLLDLEAGVKISGFRGYVLKNEGVLLQMAVLWHALQKLRQNGFQLTIPPTLVKEFALVGSGHFPFDRANVYSVVEPGVPKKSPKSESLYLVGTSEPALLALYAREVLREENLPVKLCGFSPCYRSEIGSYGRDTKGIYRIHEFWKVEQVILCRNDIQESLHWLEELRSISEEILQDLELPYRVVQNCTGDMGPGKYKMYDLETWMPSRQGYGETHSDSALLDWQARRLNIKYRDRAGKTQFAHTLNNTGIASPRILIALLENNQLSDGRVKVPKVLQPYLGQKVITPK
jgi:seryl-tRNA synthetase